MSEYIIFNGTDSRDYSIEIFPSSVDNGAETEYDLLQVAGVDGDVIYKKKRRANVSQIYSGVIYDNFAENYAAFREFLLAREGYFSLEDSIHPDEFYEAYFRGELEVIVHKWRNAGKFKLEFSRKPQRFLKSGLIEQLFSADGTIENPTSFSSKPLIRVVGNGTLTIGNYSLTISQSGSYTDIDSELMDCYEGSENRNANVSFENYEFPQIAPGENEVSLTSGITSVSIKPRWWTL